MGNIECNCMKNPENPNKLHANFITLDKDNEYNSNDSIQANWQGDKADRVRGRSNHENPNNNEYSPNTDIINHSFFQDKLPGATLLPDHIINSPNPNILSTEAQIGEYILNYNTYPERKIYSIMYPDKTIYIGQLNSDYERDGEGIMYLEDQSKYCGEFKSNIISGYGRLIYSEGDYYEGEFQSNKPWGKGKFVKISEGVCYTGEWRNEMKNGLGKEERKDGSVYVGSYFNDIKDGMGKFTWADGTYYEGSLNNNEINGFGRIVYSDNKVYIGDWKSNQVHGKGAFYWPDNKRYVGNYQNDKKEGFGIFLFTNGKKYEGFWMNGKQHGYGVCSLKGTIKVGEWRLGKKIRWFNPNDDNLKEVIEDIAANVEDCLKFMNSIGIQNIEEENFKDLILNKEIR